MQLTEKRKWISITLLSIVVPIGLLATFRLTGVLQEPPTIKETITAETVHWNMSRPSQTVTVDKWVNNSYFDETVFINSSIHIAVYLENSQGWPSYGDDEVHVTINVYANTGKGYVHSMIVRFSIIDASALLFIEPHPEATFSRNLRINRIFDPATSKREAYVDANGINRPNNASLEVFSFWVLFDKNNLDHEMSVASEITYFNGTAFQKIILPIQVGLIASDNNDSFGDALEIQPGTYSGFYLYYVGKYDMSDFYKIYAPQGYEICVSAPTRPEDPLITVLLLYNPSRIQVTSTEYSIHPVISYLADSSGYWFIEVRTFHEDCHGFYSLNVSLREGGT